MKNFYIILLFALFFGTNGFAQIIDDTIDDPGDIAIVAYSNASDGFSFVFLDNCPNGTSIRFIDEEWNGTAFDSENSEGDVVWTNNSGFNIDRGTVVNIQSTGDTTFSASVGVVIEDNSNFRLAQSGDGILAVTGTRAVPGNFLTFFGDTTDSSLTGTSLVNGETANQQASYGSGYYSGSTDCSAISVTDCSARLNTKANWTLSNSYSYPSAVISSINFGILNNTDLLENKKLQVFPSVITNELTVSAASKKYVVKIVSLLGVEVFSRTSDSETIQIDMAALQPGVYFVKVEFEEGSSILKVLKK
ncbi:T9SS type A sorting domain-containing protein [Flavicella sediminum]|uniref:T9SS type A sorting domain-containing protein n=1 Tax=Flavicella sediminum TaxID=2585141 RepID=UPI00111EAEDA|nr:T9SS type A sorting domain-containing protein [Flavicella sediminum]